MKPAAWIFITALFCSCGGGEEAATEDTQALSASEIVQGCVVTGLDDFVDLLNLFLNRLEGGAGAPRPEFDLLAGLLSGGVVPWTLDLDDDGVPDLEGTVFFTDADGNVTIPFDLGALLGGGLDDPASLLDDLPAGTTLHLTYEFDDLALESGESLTGDGELVFGFDSATSAVTVGGSGSFSSGECGYDYDLTDIEFALLSPGEFPVAELSFEVTYGSETLTGTIELDGSGIAVIRIQVDGEEEVLRVDLRTGSLVS
jgi:hypothetical protein